MKIWYETWKFNSTILPVEVARETESSLFLLHGSRERRVAKQSTHNAYFPSFEEAKAYLVERTERRIEGLKSSLDKATMELGLIQRMEGL